VKVAVVGLGKIGLPLAAQYASRGMDVAGYDIDADKVASINGGCCPIAGEDGLEDALKAAIAAQRFVATTEPGGVISTADVVVLIVPVGLTNDRHPDFSQLDAATMAIGSHIRPEALVVVETTVPVGTTRNRVGQALGRMTGLAASPERVSSGRILRDLRTYPKVIGAIDDESWKKAEQFYTAALDAPRLIRVRDPETAEFVKIAEGIYRDMNIALASELARYADSTGVDASEAFAAANTQPYAHLHQPGVGVGGHCLPVYPYFLPDDGTTRLPRLAREANDAMARYSVERLETAIGALQNRTVLILGLAYRANVKEAAHSSTFLIVDALRERGAHAIVHDALYADDEIRAYGLTPAGALPLAVDAIIVQAWHDAYRELDLRGFAGCRAVLDGRNALERSAVESAGMSYVGIGR
jgi:nucleotide sugar dehydrogenase